MKKLIKKWNLWVHKQCTDDCSRRKVNICGYCSCTVHWTVTAFLQKRVKTKKEKKKKEQNAASHKRRRSLSAIQTSTIFVPFWYFFKLEGINYALAFELWHYDRLMVEVWNLGVFLKRTFYMVEDNLCMALRVSRNGLYSITKWKIL